MRRALLTGMAALSLTAPPAAAQDLVGPLRWQAPAVPAPELTVDPAVETTGTLWIATGLDRPDQAAENRSVATLALAGVGGWAAGWLAGVPVFWGLDAWRPFDRDAVDDGTWVPGIPIAMGTGQMIGIPLAVHLANRRQGNLGASTLAAAGLSLLGAILLYTDNLDTLYDDGWPILFSIPVAQIASSILIEKRTSR